MVVLFPIFPVVYNPFPQHLPPKTPPHLLPHAGTHVEAKLLVPNTRGNFKRKKKRGWFFFGELNNWLVVEPTHLKNMSQIGFVFPKEGMNIKNIWVATTQTKVSPVAFRLGPFMLDFFSRDGDGGILQGFRSAFLTLILSVNFGHCWKI